MREDVVRDSLSVTCERCACRGVKYRKQVIVGHINTFPK